MKSALNFNTASLDIKEVGTVMEVKRSIAKIAGFPSCINGQLVIFESGVKGMVIGFNEDEVIVLIMGDDSRVKGGERVESRPEPFRIPVGNDFIGRVVNCLAEARDDRGEITHDALYPVFRDAPPVIDREPLKKPLHSGIKIIDTMTPLAKGQRELIIGDRMTGKSTLCIDAILNQKGKDVICIYCYVGRSFFSLEKTIRLLKSKGALDYTIVVAAPASSNPGEQFIVPYSAVALGEYFMDNGKDVLIVFDDLTRHAWIYRQISLILGKSPGREAYPGDVFYIHSQLMERAGKFNAENGGGSMSFLPILETQQGDVTDHISSNVVSMTDGQIYTSSALFNEGFKPSIDLGLSVSRIGSKVHSPAMKEVSGTLRLDYIQYNELVRLTRMKARVSESIEKRLKKGEVLKILLTQAKNEPVSLEKQIVIFYAYQSNIFEVLPLDAVKKFEQGIIPYLKKNSPSLLSRLAGEAELSDSIKDEFNRNFIEFFKQSGVV